MRSSTKMMMMQNGARKERENYRPEYERDRRRYDYDRYDGYDRMDYSRERREPSRRREEYSDYDDDYRYRVNVQGSIGMAEEKRFDAKKWAAEMKNEDGTRGAHWDMQQTEGVRNSRGMNDIEPEAFYVTMNMMYSDYQNVMKKFGVDRPEVYAEMAKAFLCDKDSKQGMEKLKAYYCYIVK